MVWTDFISAMVSITSYIADFFALCHQHYVSLFPPLLLILGLARETSASHFRNMCGHLRKCCVSKLTNFLNFFHCCVNDMPVCVILSTYM